MIHNSLRWARRTAVVVGLGVAFGLLGGLQAQAAQSASSKRPVAQKVAKTSKVTKTVKTVKVVSAKKKVGKSAQLAQLAQRDSKSRKKMTLQAKVKRAPGDMQAKAAVTPSRRMLAVSAAPMRSSLGAAVDMPSRVSVGDAQGLRLASDALSLNSNAVLVMDQNTHEVLFSKNDKAVLPIASLTKLMTGLLIADAKLPMDEEIVISADDVDTLKGSSSRLAVGTRLTRGEALHLALMSSENRAAHALGRTYPGGLSLFVRLMNQKAAELGMRDTRYVEPTGLSSQNQSSAQDLARLVSVAHQRPLLRDLSTSPSYEVASGKRMLQYRNTNRLIDKDEWNIGLQKTGYISEAGRCLVMQATLAGRQVIMVFLDAAGKAARLGDAERVRHWLESSFTSAPHNQDARRRG